MCWFLLHPEHSRHQASPLSSLSFFLPFTRFRHKGARAHSVLLFCQSPGWAFWMRLQWANTELQNQLGTTGLYAAREELITRARHHFTISWQNSSLLLSQFGRDCLDKVMQKVFQFLSDYKARITTHPRSVCRIFWCVFPFYWGCITLKKKGYLLGIQ